MPFTKLALTPTSATPSATPTSTGLPLAVGTRDDCNSYFDGAVFQTDISKTDWKSQCQLAAALYEVNLDDFGLWNPDVGDVTLGSCSFKTGVQYCGKLYFGEKPPSAQVPLIELPVRVSRLKRASTLEIWADPDPHLRKVHQQNALNSATLQKTGNGESTMTDDR